MGVHYFLTTQDTFNNIDHKTISYTQWSYENIMMIIQMYIMCLISMFKMMI